MPLVKQWLAVSCPKCKAKSGESCKLVGKQHPCRGSRARICHRERVARFKQLKPRAPGVPSGGGLTASATSPELTAQRRFHSKTDE